MKKCRLAGMAIAIALLVGLAITGWAQAKQPAKKPNTGAAKTLATGTAKMLDIGIATPLTGPAASVGSNLRNAVILAAENQNAKGGVTIGGEKYLLNVIVMDTKFDPTTAKAVAEELVYKQKVKIIFGPSPVELASIQSVTEPNKILIFGMSPIPGLCAPDKPYTFFVGGQPEKMYSLGGSYIKKYYPKAKKVVTVYADLGDLPLWQDTAKLYCSKMGFEWLGLEKYSPDTTDFSPVVQKLLAKKPDVVDIAGSGGAMGAIIPILIKQLREAGYEGLIWMPTIPAAGVMESTIPSQHLNKIVTNDFDLNSRMVTSDYRAVYNQYIAKFKVKPIDFMGEAYNATKALFDFLNTQKTMDTTEWMKALEKYRWKGIYGHEEYWAGYPVYKINRFLFNGLWVSEWKNGKLTNTQVAEKFPYEWFTSETTGE